MSIEGIKLDDSTPFRQWAESVIPFLNEAAHYIAEGISGDDLAVRQEKYTGYAGRMVEIYAEADTHYKNALAKATEKYATKVSVSLVSKVAEGDCTNEYKVYQFCRCLNKTLSDQLISIASRMKYEGNINITGSGRIISLNPVGFPSESCSLGTITPSRSSSF